MSDCPAYRPDHNGECTHCDEWADAHSPEALAAGETWALYRSMRDADLRDLRTAFELDAASAKHEDTIRFCIGRMALIDGILDSR